MKIYYIYTSSTTINFIFYQLLHLQMQTIVIFISTVLVAIVLASSQLSVIAAFNNSDSSIDNNNNNQFLLQTALAQSVMDTTPDISTNTTDTMSLATNSTKEQDILRQGIITSSQARQNETSQIAVILPHRLDGKSYTGVLTFSASRPVEISLLHKISIDDNILSKIDLNKFGKSLPKWIRDIPIQHKLDNNGTTMQVISTIVPDYGISTPYYSASIPFVANAITLWSEVGEPFMVAYQVSAKLGQPEIVNYIESTANNINATIP